MRAHGMESPDDGSASGSGWDAWASAGQERLGTSLAMVTGVGRAVVGTSRDRLDLVDAAIDQAVADVLPMREPDIAGLVLALCDDQVRDASMVQPDLAHTLAAQRLWSALVVATPQPYRALPASMLTYTAFLLGDAQLLRDAIGSALDIEPDDQPVPLCAPTGLLMPPAIVRRAAERTAADARARIQEQRSITR
jgi:hypothetical protein